MKCREFERRLEGSAQVDPEVVLHLGSCASCRELSEIARASLGEAPPPDRLLTAAVIARTGGSACGPAGERLTELLDGTLQGMERDLVVSHLDGCASCEELADTLGWVSRELPALAAVDPGEEFTAAVLRATRPDTIASPHPTRLPRWLAALWERPRFTWEAAYAGSLVIWLLFGAGFAPFRQVPARALEMARSNPVRALAGKVQPAALGRQVWQGSGGRVVEKAQGLTGGLAGLREASGSFARHGAEALGSAFRGDLSGSAVRLKDMGGDLKRIYDRLKRRKTESNPGSQEA